MLHLTARSTVGASTEIRKSPRHQGPFVVSWADTDGVPSSLTHPNSWDPAVLSDQYISTVHGGKTIQVILSSHIQALLVTYMRCWLPHSFLRLWLACKSELFYPSPAPSLCVSVFTVVLAFYSWTRRHRMKPALGPYQIWEGIYIVLLCGCDVWGWRVICMRPVLDWQSVPCAACLMTSCVSRSVACCMHCRLRVSSFICFSLSFFYRSPKEKLWLRGPTRRSYILYTDIQYGLLPLHLQLRHPIIPPYNSSLNFIGQHKPRDAQFLVRMGSRDVMPMISVSWLFFLSFVLMFL